MKKKISTSIAFLMLIGMAMPSLAKSSFDEEESLPLKSQIYAGVSFLHADYAYVNLDESQGYMAHLGFRFSNGMLLELNNFDFGDADVTDIDGFSLNMRGNAYYLGYEFYEKGFAAFIKAGGYSIETELDADGVFFTEDSSGFAIGAGLRYEITDFLGVRAEFIQYNDVEDFDDELDIRVVHLGGEFRF